MANPVCTNSTLNLACFKGQLLSRKARQAFRIWYMANELARLGGTDYRLVLSTGTGSLLDAATQQFDKYSMDDMDAALTAIMFNNAIASGASVSSSPNTTVPNIRHLVNNVDSNTATKMEILLACQLGVHKTRPQ